MKSFTIFAIFAMLATLATAYPRTNSKLDLHPRLKSALAPEIVNKIEKFATLVDLQKNSRSIVAFDDEVGTTAEEELTTAESEPTETTEEAITEDETTTKEQTTAEPDITTAEATVPTEDETTTDYETTTKEQTTDGQPDTTTAAATVPTSPMNKFQCINYHMDNIQAINQGSEESCTICGTSYDSSVSKIEADALVAKNQNDEELSSISMSLNGCDSIQQAEPGLNCQVDLKSVVTSITLLSSNAQKTLTEYHLQLTTTETTLDLCIHDAIVQAKTAVEKEYDSMMQC